MIVLHTLGDATILVGDRTIRPSSPLVFASLLYLAMERGRRVPRAALQGLLFPDSDERSGAHSLRQLLYKLRQLGAPLESDAASVLVPAECVQDDTSLTNATHSATVSFLPDYEPDISERYTEWLDSRRAEVAKEVRRQLASAIETHREALNWPAVERDAQLLLSVDPFNEVGTFALAEAAALSGRKAAAIKILSDYEKETGRSDLRLPASLLRRRIVQAVPEPVATLPALPFVGRDAEVKELRRYIARARAGHPCMYVIGGEAGIGKTRLLTETAALAALEGVSVFTVRCQSHYASRPLSVFIELVPALRAAPGALGVSPQSMASLNSLTTHTDEQIERPPDSRDDIMRSELLLSAIRDLIDAVASESTLVVAVEDAHWADPDSLRALNRLVQGVRHRSLFVACTTRTPETFPHSVAIDDQTIVRRLKPLESEAMGALAERLLPRHREENHDDAGDSLLAWSVRTSGGNPLFLQMLCSHFVATGEAFVIPTSVLSAVTRRVEQLSEECRRILVLCALLGSHASIDLLRALTGWDHLRLFSVFQHLEGDGYLTLENEAIRVAHDLVSQAAISLVSPISRRVLHGAVAAALEQRYDARNESSLLWDCAVQWEQSGDSTKAVEFLIKCARHAVRIGRASEAVTLLSRAEQSARSISERTAVLRESLLASRAAMQWTLATEHAQRLLQLQPHALDHSSHEFAVFQALWNTEFIGNDSIGRLRRCVNASEASIPHRIDAAHLLICIAHESGNAQLARDAFDAIKDLLDQSIGTSTNRTVAAMYEISYGDVRRGRSIITEMISTCWYFDSVADELRAALNSSSLLAMAGDTDRSIELARRYVARCDALGLHSWCIEFQTHVCMLYCIKEEFDAAQYWLELIKSQGGSLDGASALRVLGGELELCIARADLTSAMGLLQSPDLANLGDSVRGRAYFKSLEIRCRQIEPAYQVDDATLEELRRFYEQTRSLSCADCLVIALAEALWRRGRVAEVDHLLAEYLTTARRELGPASPSLMRLLECYSVSAKQLLGRRRLA